MNRTEFEALRDIPGKVIRQDIRFSKRQATAPAVAAEGIAITNAGSVDGTPHRPAGRSHKHALQSERCPDRNLPDGVVDRADLSGKSVRELFDVFCAIGNIEYIGAFESPDSP